MKISQIFWINSKKLKKRTKRALFLIIPVGILMALSVVISSQVSNIETAINSSVFGTINEQNTLIQVESEDEQSLGQAGSGFMGGMGRSGFESNEFSQSDVEALLNIENVEEVTLMAEIPVSNITADDLFEDTKISVSSFVGLDSETAGLYTDQDFSYTEGDAIPIILNASDFKITYEDWGDDGTITLTRPENLEEGESPSERMSAFKSEAIEYDKEELIGKTITISVGGLDSLVDYETSMSESGPVMSKLSDEEMLEKEEERESLISAYWDYDKISEKLEYTFVVAGVIESSSNRSSYIPSDFADVLMNDYISNQLEALVVDSGDVDADVLNADFTGLTYDGYELSNNGVGMFSQMMGRMGGAMRVNPSENSDSLDTAEKTFSVSDSVAIPGLVIEIDEDDSVIGIYTDTDVYSQAEKYASSLSVKIGDVSSRNQVIEDINNAGYAVQDTSNMGVFGELQETLSSVSTGLVIGFVILVAGIVVLTMSKMVSESTKEIGIFRAIGVKKSEISLMFILQALMYVAIGYIAGILLGILMNMGISGLVASWFESFVDSTISQTYGVVQSIDSSLFMAINWGSIYMYSLLLLCISLIISFLPARSAASVSPVVAINNE